MGELQDDILEGLGWWLTRGLLEAMLGMDTDLAIWNVFYALRVLF